MKSLISLAHAHTQLSGKELPMDQWILSRLTVAMDDSNRGFAEYDFPLVTTALYNFWLYELCDVYLEYVKPIVYGGNEEAKTTSRNVLYTCLDVALRLLSPFMPFLTEELFQRLPRRTPDCPPSVCVSPYPEEVSLKVVTQFVSEILSHHFFQLPFRNDTLDSQVKLMQEVVRTIRSMRQDYLPPKARPDGKRRDRTSIVCS